MSKPFDATLKDLAASFPEDFLSMFDHPPVEPVSALNVDLSTVTTSADFVCGVGNPLKEVVHIDFQSSASADLHRDLLAYHSLLLRQHRAPVSSIVLLLRPQGQHSNLTGRIEYSPRPGLCSTVFHYGIVRLWDIPAEHILQGGPGILPMAPLCRLPEGVELEESLKTVIQQAIDRILQEAPLEAARRLVTAAYVLTGLRVSRTVAFELFKSVTIMKDSDTYQAILEEGVQKGREEGRGEGEHSEAVKILLRLGKKKWGDPPSTFEDSLASISDLTQIEHFIDRIEECSGWEDLLNGSTA